jgi:hypothetical protein
MPDNFLSHTSRLRRFPGVAATGAAVVALSLLFFAESGQAIVKAEPSTDTDKTFIRSE